jgi:N-acyl homoserine lactone hydrolase
MMLVSLLSACIHIPEPPVMSAPAPLPTPAVSATLQVHVVADGALPARLTFTGRPGAPLPAKIYAYVLDHPSAGRVVIDPGYSRRTRDDPGDVPGHATVRQTGLVMGTPIVDQLGDGEDVRHILVTHMHNDHGTAVEDFPDAMVHIDPVEWAFGLEESLRHATAPPIGAPARDITPLVYDDGPIGPFERHADVFGDGVLLAIPTPGHTPGHAAFLVNLEGQRVLLTGDIAWFDEHWQEPALKGRLARWLVEDDWRMATAAAWQVRAMKELYPDIVVLSGHDPQNLQRLPEGQPHR